MNILNMYSGETGAWDKIRITVELYGPIFCEDVKEERLQTAVIHFIL